jgi:hypothetical protein
VQRAGGDAWSTEQGVSGLATGAQEVLTVAQGKAAVLWTRCEGAGGLKLKVKTRRNPNREADRPGLEPRCGAAAGRPYTPAARSARCWPVRGVSEAVCRLMEREGERRAGWVCVLLFG